MVETADRRYGPPASEVVAQPETRQGKAKKDEAMPLPPLLMKIYYIFPIVLYVPDIIFNFYVYSDGSGLKVTGPDTLLNPQFYLWAFLSAGIVGMAWLLSVLAPWHWVRGNKFQSIFCWIGVMIATSVTIWNSLAFRSEKFATFNTDRWFQQTFNLPGASLTMFLVAVMPPFWGLFWAIVQPSVGKRSAEDEAENHVQKLERLKQEAEYKKIKAAANAEIRAAQLKGFAATLGAAKDQITTAVANNGANGEDGATADDADGRVVPIGAGAVRRLSDRRPAWQEETTESGEHEIVRGAAAGAMSYSVASASHDQVFEAPSGEYPARSLQSSLFDRLTPNSTESETLLSTSRPGMPRAGSTLLRNYADNEHVMRAVDADVERMRAQGMKITIKSFAEYRHIELSLSKQLLAKWREWKQQQAQPDVVTVAATADVSAE